MSEQSPKKATIPVRVDDALQKKIAEASKMTGLAQADIIRLCTAMGIEDLRRVDWDLAGTLSQAANPPAQSSLRALPKVADESVVYPKKGTK